MEWSVIEQGQGAINMNPCYRMRVHELKMMKRPDCIYWSQVDYKSPAWYSCEKGKRIFKMYQEKCFDRSGQLLKPFYKTPCVGETSSETVIWFQSSTLKKKKMNSHQKICGGKAPRMTRETNCQCHKRRDGKKTGSLSQQNKPGNVAWLFFRSTWLDNPKAGKENSRQILT